MDTRYTRWMPQTQRTHTPAKHLYIIILRSKYAEVVNSRVAKSVVGWCVLQRHGITALEATISTTLWHNSNGNAGALAPITRAKQHFPPKPDAFEWRHFGCNYHYLNEDTIPEAWDPTKSSYSQSFLQTILFNCCQPQSVVSLHQIWFKSIPLRGMRV